MLALEAVKEALTAQLCTLGFQLFLLDACPHAGYYSLEHDETLWVSPEQVHICSGCLGGWGVGCVPDTDAMSAGYKSGAKLFSSKDDCSACPSWNHLVSLFFATESAILRKIYQTNLM